jgi:hypothetical protein
MPRWPKGYAAGKWQICPSCGGKKDHGAATCRKCSTPGKPLVGLTGEDHPAWKGGQRIDEDGYIRTYAPGHPWPRRSGYVFEHVRIMELAIGRRLEPGETVHHRDGDRQNNAVENLEILKRGDHSRLHRLKDAHLRERDSLGRFAGKEVTSCQQMENQ